MAVELERFLSEQLDRLPMHHPDRRFLEGLQETLAGYIEQTGAAGEPAFTGDNAPVDQAAPADSASSVGEAGHAITPVLEPAAAHVEQQEQERVHLRGRLGQRVRYSTTPKGVRRAEFNLAVAVDEDHADWHTVLAFRDRADKLEQANPQKGQYVEVIGYRHTEERKTRDGQPKTVERVIAAHIRLR